jgi:hypothetical protein
MGQWGQEVYLTLARAAVNYERLQGDDKKATPARAAVNNKRREKVDVEKECATLEERLDAAEKLLPLLPESQQKIQRHRIAGFKAALTKRFLRAKAAT